MFITSTSSVTNNNKQTSNNDPLIFTLRRMSFIVTLHVKTDPPFSGPHNVVQVGTKRLKGGKMCSRTPYNTKYNRSVHPAQSV